MVSKEVHHQIKTKGSKRLAVIEMFVAYEKIGMMQERKGLNKIAVTSNGIVKHQVILTYLYVPELQ